MSIISSSVIFIILGGGLVAGLVVLGLLVSHTRKNRAEQLIIIMLCKLKNDYYTECPRMKH